MIGSRLTMSIIEADGKLGIKSKNEHIIGRILKESANIFFKDLEKSMEILV